ncbi:type II CAAX prenyl endopeptidase Rce1 family protein [Deinococcus oregonensis]|uniref:Type II CAAX prenyl endopeptidase Rce1 family protein n=1 Tax=Deinococcus oregonensis TaxID=1805970 RepID=A0ABV6ASL5_9DEIO
MKRFALPIFFIVAFGLSWLMWWPILVTPPELRATIHPAFHLLGSLGPGLSALMVAAWLGRNDLMTLVRGLFRWRVGWWPWAFAILGPVLVLLVGLGVAALLGQPWPPVQALLRVAEYPHLGGVALVLAEVVFYGYGEEVGWRGFALPRLIPRFGPIWASVLLSVPWALWHLPLLLRNETYTSMNPALLAGWFISLLTGAVLMSWLYQQTRGSLLTLAVFHGLLDVVMANEGASQLALAAMGALVTVWGVFAVGALRRTQLQHRAAQTAGAL